MDIIVLNESFEAVGIVDEYQSVIWTDRYSEAGDFELYMPCTVDILKKVRQNYYLMNPENIDENGYYRMMIVEQVKIETNAENGNFVTFSGRSLESILDRRIVWGLKTLEEGSLQTNIQTLLNENIINPESVTSTEYTKAKDTLSDWSLRKIDNFIFDASSDSKVTALTMEKTQYTGSDLYTIITGLVSAVDLGFRVTFDYENKKFHFKLYLGTDRSDNQTTNPQVLFSPDYENLINSTYTKTNKGNKNVTLVGGSGDELDSKQFAIADDGSDEEELKGLYRRETYTDASSETNDESITDYTSVLKSKGVEALENSMDTTTFDGDVAPAVTFEYMKDYYLGDYVIVENEFGITANARITEIIENYTDSGYSLVPTFTYKYVPPYLLAETEDILQTEAGVNILYDTLTD